MKNRAIEIHDSVLDRLSLRDVNAVLYFSLVYIHESQGIPGRDAGSEWVQEAQLTIGDAVIDGCFSELPRDLWDGYVAMDGTISDNMIPVPLDHVGKIELRLEAWGEVSKVVSIRGTGAKLELIGEAIYKKEFKP